MKKHRIPTVLAATCLLLSVLIGCISGGSGSEHRILAQVAYPSRVQYPNDTEGKDELELLSIQLDWEEELRSRKQLQYTSDSLSNFLRTSIPQILSTSEGKNSVYSPLNVWLALAMLAELTDGNSRQQILDVLGSTDIESLRNQANTLWQANYCDDGVSSCRLASSLWLNEQINFRQETMDILAKYYYAEAHQGAMGSTALNRALQDWLNAQTGGLLEEQAANLEMEPETALALATAIYYRANWAGDFSKSATTQDVFFAENGEIICDFMHQSPDTFYYWAEHFSAVCKGMEDGSSMWFLLPDEGISVEQLLQEQETMDFMLAGADWENKKELTVHMSIPKFDVSSQLTLNDSIQHLGITDVFHTAADFSPTTSDVGLAVSKIQHDARVKIDEEACEAAAYTVIMVEATAMAPEELEEIDFVLDRPFIFVISNAQGLPLFVGTVQQPI